MCRRRQQRRYTYGNCLISQVDVIVNSTNCQLELERGYVSKALLDRGGETLQRECHQNAPNGIKCGEVVVTSGGQLMCQLVIHGACCQWDGGTGRSKQVTLKVKLSFIN